MDDIQPVYIVEETVTNINPLGRIYNIVQHPTLAAPFLDEHTAIDCNAFTGFNQAHYHAVSENSFKWPLVRAAGKKIIDLRNPDSVDNTVYSFIVKPGAEYGWITAYSPTHNLLLGYIWKRSDYHWIHLWQHYENGKVQYRGIEFGTAGIHQPFAEILNTAVNLFGEPTFAYIDAGTSVTKRFLSFSCITPPEFTGVENVVLEAGTLSIRGKAKATDLDFKLTQTGNNEL